MLQGLLNFMKSTKYVEQFVTCLVAPLSIQYDIELLSDVKISSDIDINAMFTDSVFDCVSPDSFFDVPLSAVFYPMTFTFTTDSDLNQPSSAAICSSKNEATNSKSGVKSPRKNKHAQLRMVKGDGRIKPHKIKKTEIPELDVHPTADDYTMLLDMESGQPTSSAIG
ncbi:hypothetical protein NPIL_378641 [Nephila pilipes]|uniref:Uncharacterized protein n=1 Tax=Nephila pilipes TaxID=299642 RepID=A0A8X6TZY6_NEPPI|nr:hypothetical protein NPIL_233201 [Nephila pilipes]GFT67630.1 hypothetical protein NPIL_378641 [Nephila pilipes]